MQKSQDLSKSTLKIILSIRIETITMSATYFIFPSACFYWKMQNTCHFVTSDVTARHRAHFPEAFIFTEILARQCPSIWRSSTSAFDGFESNIWWYNLDSIVLHITQRNPVSKIGIKFKLLIIGGKLKYLYFLIFLFDYFCSYNNRDKKDYRYKKWTRKIRFKKKKGLKVEGKRLGFFFNHSSFRRLWLLDSELTFFLKNGPSSVSFAFIFVPFQTNINTILQQIMLKMSIQ